jgi:hypothetical protein
LQSRSFSPAFFWARETFINIILDAKFAKSLLTAIATDWIYDEVSAYNACDLFENYGAMLL